MVSGIFLVDCDSALNPHTVILLWELSTDYRPVNKNNSSVGKNKGGCMGFLMVFLAVHA